MADLYDNDLVFVIGGEDEHGDQHMFMTSDIMRAVARYREMKRTLSNVRGNEGFEERARPLLD